MKSMTGFGASQVSSKGVEMEARIRSVNGRFLDIRCHLPKEYLAQELELKKRIGRAFRRGTVDLYVTRRWVTNGEVGEVVVNKKMAHKWLKAYDSLAKEVGLIESLSLRELGALPEVILYQEDNIEYEEEKTRLIKCVDGAIKACLRERVREGKALKSELGGLLDALGQSCSEMTRLSAEANQHLRKKLEQGWLRLNKEVDPQRVAQEIVFYLDRADITEELVRLQEHLKSVRQMVKAADCEGKKLDFYTQELLREINTVGSKSQIPELTQQVVDAKSLVEKIKEQVQNIE